MRERKRRMLMLLLRLVEEQEGIRARGNKP